MFLDFLHYIFSNFWIWLGFTLLLVVSYQFVEDIIRIFLDYRYKSIFKRNSSIEDDDEEEYESDNDSDVEAKEINPKDSKYVDEKYVYKMIHRDNDEVNTSNINDNISYESGKKEISVADTIKEPDVTNTINKTTTTSINMINLKVGDIISVNMNGIGDAPSVKDYKMKVTYVTFNRIYMLGINPIDNNYYNWSISGEWVWFTEFKINNLPYEVVSSLPSKDNLEYYTTEEIRSLGYKYWTSTMIPKTKYTWIVNSNGIFNAKDSKDSNKVIAALIIDDIDKTFKN